MYDFSNDAIEAEHADVTFKTMEGGFPTFAVVLSLNLTGKR
jgi:hypothetical protein